MRKDVLAAQENQTAPCHPSLLANINDTEESGWQQKTRLLKGFVSESRRDNNSISNKNIGLFLVTPAAIVMLLFVIFHRAYYWRRHGVDRCFCKGHRNRAFLEEPLPRVHEEQRGAKRVVIKKDDVRLWYECFIQAFTMTVESKHLFSARDGPSVGNDNVDEKLNGHVSPMESSSCREINDDEIVALRQVAMDIWCTPVASEEDAEDVVDAQLYLRLPVQDKKGNLRIVDGQCVICFLEYEPDDKVVWSGLQCQHAFHAYCMLAWLAKGKKRCPTCRQWFVPESESRVEDEMKDHGEHLPAIALSNEATNEAQDDSRSHFENSSTAIALGIAEDGQLLHVSLRIDVDMECGNESDVAPFNDMQ